ncbi:MAG: hypothetical protein M3O41_15825 [Pseudomonadota bacterium]|nr:hypothetical protein [Pseudomonadota bacterium]
MQLPPGIVEGVAQRKVYILVPCTIDMETVGVDLRTGNDQVNLDYIRRLGVAAGIRAFERYMTLRDSLAKTLQPGPQFARTILKGTRAVKVAE